MKPEMIPVLRKAVEWAEVEAALPAGQWDQTWVYLSEDTRVQLKGLSTGCGSSYCIAGWIVATRYDVENPYTAIRGTDEPYVMAHAADLLGLTEIETDALFAGGNSISDVRHIAEQIAGERL